MQSTHLDRRAVEKLFRVPQRRLHAAYSGRAFGLDDLEFGVGRKLAAMTVPAQVVGTRYMHPAHGREDRLGAQFPVLSLPQESGYCLRYLAAVDHLESEAEQILQFAASQDAIYDYQIARTFYEANTFPGQLLKLCRRWAEDRNRERWLRTYSIAILGAAGKASDLSAIETSYASATDELERAEIARALARMELSRRNAFYRRVCKDGDMVSWAIEDAVSRTEQN